MDIANLFQQTQENMQRQLKNQTVEGSAGGGKVTVTANGCQQITKIVIDPEVVNPDPDEVALLEDMVVAAVNQAMQKSHSLIQGEIGKLAGGLDLSNLGNMFKQ